jgi:hypothetical protein
MIDLPGSVGHAPEHARKLIHSLLAVRCKNFRDHADKISISATDVAQIETLAQG